jgi:hypothetical protein
VSSAESLLAGPAPTEEAAPELPELPTAGRRGGGRGELSPDEDARPSKPSPGSAGERPAPSGGAARLRQALASRSALRQAVRIQAVLARPGGLEAERER